MSSVHNGWNWIPEKRDARHDAMRRLRARVLTRSLFAPRHDARIIYQRKPIDRVRSKLWKFCGCTETHPSARVHACYFAACAHNHLLPSLIDSIFLAGTRNRARRREAFHFSTFPTSGPFRQLPLKFSISSLFADVGSPSVGSLSSSGRPDFSRVRLFFSLSAENFFTSSRLDWIDRNAADARDRWISNSKWTGVKKKLVTSHPILRNFFRFPAFSRLLCFSHFHILTTIDATIKRICFTTFFRRYLMFWD